MVDDSPEYLEATKMFLSIYPTIEVVGDVRYGFQVVEQVIELKPDLVLLDLALPDISGLDLLPKIKDVEEPPVVIVVTFHNIPEYKEKAHAFGAAGFVLKADLATELMHTIKKLFNQNDHPPRNGSTSGG